MTRCPKNEPPPFHVCFKSDNLILRLAKAAGEVLGKTHDELMYAFGVYMVKRIGNYGYERILKVTERLIVLSLYIRVAQTKCGLQSCFAKLYWTKMYI